MDVTDVRHSVMVSTSDSTAAPLLARATPQNVHRLDHPDRASRGVFPSPMVTIASGWLPSLHAM